MVRSQYVLVDNVKSVLFVNTLPPLNSFATIVEILFWKVMCKQLFFPHYHSESNIILIINVKRRKSIGLSEISGKLTHS